MKIKKTLNFVPENVETIEKIAIENASYDYSSKIEALPEFREKFRHLAKVRGAYIPSKQGVSMSIGPSVAPAQSNVFAPPPPPGQPLDLSDGGGEQVPDWALVSQPQPQAQQGYQMPPQQQFPGLPPIPTGFPQHNAMMPQNQYQPAKQASKMSQFTMAMLRGAIHPDKVFTASERPRGLIIQNVTEGPVVIAIGKVSVGRGNVEDFENKNFIKIESFKAVDQIPEEFFSAMQFRDAFYTRPPSLVFITEQQYRERTQYVEAKKNHERMVFEDMRNRIEEGGHKVGHFKEGGDVSDMMAMATSSQSMYDNMPEYDDGTVVHMDVTGDIRQGNSGGLTQHMQNAVEGETVMSEDEIGNFLRSMNS